MCAFHGRFAVGHLSQFLDCLTTEHYTAAQRVIRYIKMSPAEGLFFQLTLKLNSKGLVIQIFYVWIPEGQSRAIVFWKSKKQAII